MLLALPLLSAVSWYLFNSYCPDVTTLKEVLVLRDSFEGVKSSETQGGVDFSVRTSLLPPFAFFFRDLSRFGWRQRCACFHNDKQLGVREREREQYERTFVSPQLRLSMWFCLGEKVLLLLLAITRETTDKISHHSQTVFCGPATLDNGNIRA